MFALSGNGPKKTLQFHSSDAEDSIQYIKNDQKDKSLDEIRQNLNTNQIAVKPESVKVPETSTDELAYPISSIREDKSLRKSVQTALLNGSKIYLYGDNVTIKEFEELLNIKGEISPTKSIEEMKNTRLAKPKAYVESDQSFNVIGYTIKDEPHQIYFATFISDKEESFEKKAHMYLRAILDHEIKVTKKLNKEKADTTAVVNCNKAHADTSPVSSHPDINTYYYADGTNILKGRFNTDWILSRTTETDPNYDYFSVRDNLEITPYNAAILYWAKVDHDIPYDSDNIYQWAPKDTSGSTIQVSLPWGIAYSFNPNGNIVVDEMGSQSLDYGRWVLEGRWWIGFLPNPTRFEPTTEWLSYGSYAVMDIRHWAKFHDSYYYYDNGYQYIRVSYDY